MLQKYGRHCQLCGVIGRVDVHHNNYDHLWHEDDTDLIVLCTTCHKNFHDRFDPPDVIAENGEAFWPPIEESDGTVIQGPMEKVIRRWKQDIKDKEIPKLCDEIGQERTQIIYDALELKDL